MFLVRRFRKCSETVPVEEFVPQRRKGAGAQRRTTNAFAHFAIFAPLREFLSRTDRGGLLLWLVDMGIAWMEVDQPPADDRCHCGAVHRAVVKRRVAAF